MTITYKIEKNSGHHVGDYYQEMMNICKRLIKNIAKEKCKCKYYYLFVTEKENEYCISLLLFPHSDHLPEEPLEHLSSIVFDSKSYDFTTKAVKKTVNSFIQKAFDYLLVAVYGTEINKTNPSAILEGSSFL